MTFPKDMDQAAKMLNMRIKIDVWTQGLDEDYRERIRENLRDLFCQLPARRYWQYLKRIRFMLLKGYQSDLADDLRLEDFAIDGPEDVIANGKYNLSLHNFYPCS
jgi:hypothetical protein